MGFKLKMVKGASSESDLAFGDVGARVVSQLALTPREFVAPQLSLAVRRAEELNVVVQDVYAAQQAKSLGEQFPNRSLKEVLAVIEAHDEHVIKQHSFDPRNKATILAHAEATADLRRAIGLSLGIEQGATPSLADSMVLTPSGSAPAPLSQS